MLTFFDLFAGAGGFRIAFQREGFELVGWCEIDRWCQRLYRYYYSVEELLRRLELKFKNV